MQEKQNKGPKKAHSTQAEEDWKHLETLQIVLKRKSRRPNLNFVGHHRVNNQRMFGRLFIVYLNQTIVR